MRVLIADGDREYRFVVKLHLKKLGVTEILEAADADGAFARVAAGESDILLADWNLPGGGGELVRRVRAVEELARFPCIVLLSEGTREQVLLALTTGASDCIVKPGTQEILEAKLIRFRKGRRS